MGAPSAREVRFGLIIGNRLQFASLMYERDARSRAGCSQTCDPQGASKKRAGSENPRPSLLSARRASLNYAEITTRTSRHARRRDAPSRKLQPRTHSGQGGVYQSAAAKRIVFDEHSGSAGNITS